MKRAVFLDRDGVINRAVIRQGRPYPPKDLENLEILDGVQEALKRLEKLGLYRYVLTNQPDVARGTTSKETVEKINSHLMAALPINEILTCFHDDNDNCSCRKPNPGFFHKIRDEQNIDLLGSYMVGDRWKDIEAGKIAGCKTIFIDYHYNEKQPEPPADISCSNLQEAVDWIIDDCN